MRVADHVRERRHERRLAGTRCSGHTQYVWSADGAPDVLDE